MVIWKRSNKKKVNVYIASYVINKINVKGSPIDDVGILIKDKSNQFREDLSGIVVR